MFEPQRTREEEPRPMRDKVRWDHLLTTVGLMAMGALIALVVTNVGSCSDGEHPRHQEANSPVNATNHVTKKVSRNWDALIDPELRKAKRRTDEAIEEALGQIAQLLDDGKSGTPEFAEHALGFWSKVLYLKDRLPWTDGNSHRRFLEEKFREHVLDRDELKKSLDSIVNQLIKTIQDTEYKMLMNLRADVPDLPPSHPLKQWDDTRLLKEFQKLLGAAEQKVRAQTSDELGRDLGTLIVCELSGIIFRRIAVSLGILGASGATAVETLGFTLVIGLVIDEIISWIGDWLFDPKGELVKDLNTKLDEVRDKILKGTDSEPGLRTVLKEMSEQRSKLRREVVIKLLNANE